MFRQLMKFKFYFFWTLLILMFLATSFGAVFWAQGYRFNTQTFRVVKTGLIIVKVDPREAQVNINGQKISDLTPIRLAHLLPGQYDLEIKKFDYQTWHKSIRLEANQAINFDTVRLFFVEPTQSSIDQEDIKQLSLVEPDTNISTNDGEIWYQNRLVSRFSSPVIQASTTPDRNHIIYQRDRGIRVIELDGSNDTLIIKVQSDQKVGLALTDNGKFLIYQDGGGLKKLMIR